MKVDSLRRYESADEFFLLDGTVVMKMTPGAAISVCEQARSHGFFISRIEGGIWHNPGFEARLDCIWDGVDCFIDEVSAGENNKSAAMFIAGEALVHDVFIVTVARIND